MFKALALRPGACVAAVADAASAADPDTEATEAVPPGRVACAAVAVLAVPSSAPTPAAGGEGVAIWGCPVVPSDRSRGRTPSPDTCAGDNTPDLESNRMAVGFGDHRGGTDRAVLLLLPEDMLAVVWWPFAGMLSVLERPPPPPPPPPPLPPQIASVCPAAWSDSASSVARAALARSRAVARRREGTTPRPAKPNT